MSKLFDRFERVVFAAVNRVFGEQVQAIWNSADGTVSFTGTVLFNNPTAREDAEQMTFMETDSWIEYLDPAFPGLRQFVNNKSIEHLFINGDDYVVTGINRLYDGNTYKAYVQPVNDGYGPK